MMLMLQFRIDGRPLDCCSASSRRAALPPDSGTEVQMNSGAFAALSAAGEHRRQRAVDNVVVRALGVTDRVFAGLRRAPFQPNKLIAHLLLVEKLDATTVQQGRKV